MNNTVLLIIGASLIMLMMMFGSNPVEDARERRAEQMKKKDPLISAIEEHNAKNSTRVTGGGGGYSSGRNSLVGGSGLGYTGQAYQGANPYRRQPNLDMAPQGQPEAAPPVVNQPPSYYPPPPLQNGTMANRPQGRRNQAQKPILPAQGGIGGDRLQDGQQIIYEGPWVYSYDSEGNKIRLRDGTYILSDGQSRLVVRGGQKVINPY